jgi:Na+/H+ antiporter NhaD/arsenite permease-like protein
MPADSLRPQKIFVPYQVVKSYKTPTETALLCVLISAYVDRMRESSSEISQIKKIKTPKYKISLLLCFFFSLYVFTSVFTSFFLSFFPSAFHFSFLICSFLFSAPVQTGPEAHPASYTTDSGYFPEV